MAELLRLRDLPRDEIPTGYSASEWRSNIRGEIRNWAAEASKPAAASRWHQDAGRAITAGEIRELAVLADRYLWSGADMA